MGGVVWGGKYIKGGEVTKRIRVNSTPEELAEGRDAIAPPTKIGTISGSGGVTEDIAAQY